ncbi:MAG: TonB-dependent receptor plug domain-containing protein [Gemmatimonadales bacterium]
MRHLSPAEVDVGERHLFRMSHVAALLVLALPARVTAQAAAVVAGTVRAQNGAPLTGVRVIFTPANAATETGPGGRFLLSLPRPVEGGWLKLSAVGYAPDSVALPRSPSGRRREIAVTLAPLHLLDALTVVATGDRPLLNTEDATTGGALEQAELEALPTDAREPLALAFNIPGVAQSTGFFGDAPPLSINGANSLYTQYTLDGLDNNEGFLGGPRVEFPLGGLSRLAVLANSYSSGYGRSANGVVSQESRAGSNGWDGETFAYYRPGNPLDAEPKLVPVGVDPEGFQRFQAGAGVGGPLARDRTFFSAAAEYSNEDEDRIGSTAQTQFIGTEKREKVKLFGRLDHGWSSTQTTTLRFAMSHVNRAGQGSGVVVPEADITTRRIGSLTALTHRITFGGGAASNTISAQVGTFRWYFPPTRSDFSRPQVTIVAPDGVTVEAVVGSSNFIFDEKETQLQLRDVFETAVAERHTLRLGGDVITASFQLLGANTNPNGAYTVYNDGNISPAGRFVSIDDVPADVRVRSYTIDASPQQVDLTQTLAGAFVEDRWRVSPSLTVVAGFRWDYDDITSRGESVPDLNNFQPRASFNWYRTPTSVVRGGVGVYTGKLPYAIFSDAVQFGPEGNAVVTFEGADAPGYLEGPSQAELQARRDQLPAREVRRAFALGLEQPHSYQASVGYQFQVGDNWAFGVDGVWVETRNLPRSVDLNAVSRPITAADSVDQPAGFGDQFRPTVPTVGGFRRLTTTESGGRARYKGIHLYARRRLAEAWTLDANWVWSRAENDTEDINFNASQANCFSRSLRDAVTGAACTSSEWADAVNDRRHKVTLRSVYTVAERVRLSLIADFQSGQPVNRVASFRDLDGSGGIFGNGFVGNHDRFAGIPRNGERLPSFFELSGGVAYLLGIASGRLEVRADVFNALNSTEWGNFANGIPGGGSRTQTGRPGDPIELRAPGRPRQMQLSARYVF